MPLELLGSHHSYMEKARETTSQEVPLYLHLEGIAMEPHIPSISDHH